MDDLELKLRQKKQEVRDLENKKQIKKLKEELTTLKAIRELPYFKGKKDSEIIDLIKAKFTANSNLTNFH